MHILGLQKLTLLDFPGRMAAIVFLGGCNFRCPFCHNASLVLSPGTMPAAMSEEDFFAFLHKRAGILEGVCVTGGEPTLHAGLPDFLAAIKDEGYLVKLDTNGTRPQMLEQLLREGLVDYVAMDIKAGRDNYVRVCGLETDSCAPLLEKVARSADLLMSGPADYEFRTTAVKGLHSMADFADIGNWLSGCRAYYLQSFRDCPEVLLQNHPFDAFSSAELQSFLDCVQKKIPQAVLRG